jgi:hypothetical protein
MGFAAGIIDAANKKFVAGSRKKRQPPSRFIRDNGREMIDERLQAGIDCAAGSPAISRMKARCETIAIGRRSRGIDQGERPAAQFGRRAQHAPPKRRKRVRFGLEAAQFDAGQFEHAASRA